ncbi:hypothetical protein Rsub_09334 [Raphidocelis subcapitata]|uniref:CARDB domain-containing protein n=1 Tax=Raphidocelis subcapitata TaxID=307507 RepID=A0A2V0P9Q4_9CHLO|nr:hypothetical protein Rsub_09334 [Raphidocelis subcapitata]|eukprot:GBF96588.1 hypothetical protein Rsub_09334 [Raphidocelis subcapitata]
MAASAAPLRAAALTLALALAFAAPSVRLDGPGELPAFASSFKLGAAGPLSADGAVPNYIFSDSPLQWWSLYPVPIKPEVGGKRSLTMYIVNVGGAVIPKGTVVSFWANRTIPAKCGETAGADAEYKLPELKPYQTYALKATVPYSSDLTAGAVAWTNIFIDSMCTAWKKSDEDNQFPYYTDVVAKGTEYAYAASLIGSPDERPFGILWPPAYEQSPTVPQGGSTYTAFIRVQNVGNVALPAGVFIQVWPQQDYINIIPTSCNNTGGISIELPKIGPGKIKTIKVEGLVAPKGSGNPGPTTSDTTVVTDSTCKLHKYPFSVHQGYYNMLTAPGAYIGGVQIKGQLTYAIKTSPKAPKANTTMTVKVKFENRAAVEGPIGKVAVWLKPAPEWSGPKYCGYTGVEWPDYFGQCDYSGFVASADFSDVMIKPGKSKTVKIADVPVPTAPGWWQVSALPDINCTLPAKKTIRPVAPYAAFEVVAP